MVTIDNRLLEMLSRYASEYELPYVDTPFEYHAIVVDRLGPSERDRWVVRSDQVNRFHSGVCRFTSGRDDTGETAEEYDQATVHPLVEAFVQAEEIAAEWKLQADRVQEIRAARSEAQKGKAHL